MNEKKPNPPTDPRDGFTPGPWIVGEPPHDDCIYGPDDWIVAKACPEQPAMLANARLIASAPTLLADNERQAKVIERLIKALRHQRGELHRMPSNNRILEDWRNEMLRSIDAALALAEGGEKGEQRG